MSSKMTRREFLKKMTVASVAVYAFSHVSPVQAAVVSDNLKGGFEVGPTAPSSINLHWIDTSNGRVHKYYDTGSKTWVPVTPVWK